MEVDNGESSDDEQRRDTTNPKFPFAIHFAVCTRYCETRQYQFRQGEQGRLPMDRPTQIRRDQIVVTNDPNHPLKWTYFDYLERFLRPESFYPYHFEYNVVFCPACNMAVNGTYQCEEHVIGKRHRKKEKEYRLVRMRNAVPGTEFVVV